MRRRVLIFGITIGLMLVLCTGVCAVDVAGTSGAGSIGFSFEIATTIAELVAKILAEHFEVSINNWLAGIVNDIFGVVDSLMIDLLHCVFYAEDLISAGGTTVLTDAMLDNLYGFLYTVSSSLVALKFIRKGFQIYILWRDGDADSNPADMIKGVGESVVYMIAFPFLYEKCVDLFIYLATGIMGRLGVSENPTLFSTFSLSEIAAMGTLFIFFILVFFIMVFILWIMLMKQGFELLIMRVGFPLSTQGLIDSDKALFKNYLQVFWKVAYTAIIQVSIMSLAFRVIATLQVINLFGAIALMAAAIGTPKLLQQFLVQQGGGGTMQKAYSVAMIARTAKMLFV